MTPLSLSRPFPRLPLRALATACLATGLLGALPARADEYSDVAQLVRTGRFAEAVTKADQYLAGKPKDPQMRFFKGVAQTEMGKANDAIATFSRLTEDFPELPEPYNNLAVLYAGQSQFDRARAALEMAIKTNPSYSTAHENLGDVYAKLASQAYTKALQLDASNTNVPPKLNLIRELFAPVKPGTRPAPPPVAAAAPPGPVLAQIPAAAPAIPSIPPVAAPPAAQAPAAAPAAKPPRATDEGPERQAVEAAVRDWAAAWAARDMSRYLASYGREFDPPGNQNRRAWKEERQRRIMGKSRIQVRVSDLQVSVQGNRAQARFRQDYAADGLNVSSRKTLDLAQAGGRWVIVREHASGG